ncbi:hypothetical protein M885DRAFT_508292 [Pelagophyceae sp. CCMP2097]|nr:hypothetical protein M885DRAFT_508292 [Pelagophyceae sp. CCMP2097]
MQLEAARLDAARSLLGVDANAPAAAARKSYLRLALRCHPDKGGDADAFQKLQDAFEAVDASFDAARAHRADAVRKAAAAEAAAAAAKARAHDAAAARAHETAATRAHDAATRTPVPCKAAAPREPAAAPAAAPREPKRERHSRPLDHRCAVCGQRFASSRLLAAHTSRRHAAPPATKGPPTTSPPPRHRDDVTRRRSFGDLHPAKPRPPTTSPPPLRHHDDVSRRRSYGDAAPAKPKAPSTTTPRHHDASRRRTIGDDEAPKRSSDVSSDGAVYAVMVKLARERRKKDPDLQRHDDAPKLSYLHAAPKSSSSLWSPQRGGRKVAADGEPAPEGRRRARSLDGLPAGGSADVAQRHAWFQRARLSLESRNGARGGATCPAAPCSDRAKRREQVSILRDIGFSQRDADSYADASKTVDEVLEDMCDDNVALDQARPQRGTWGKRLFSTIATLVARRPALRPSGAASV